MIPKINVVWIRWALLVINLGVLSLFASRAFAFFWTGSEEQAKVLPDSETVKVPVGDQSAGDPAKFRQISEALHRVPPKIIEPVKVVAPINEVAQTGGELDGWKILSVIVEADGPDRAFVEGNVAGGDASTPAASALKDKRSTRTRPPKGGKSTSRGASNTRLATMIEGMQFLRYPVTIQDVSTNPDTVTYVHNSTNKVYKIVREDLPKDFKNGISSLDPENAPALPEIPYDADEMGKITERSAEPMKPAVPENAENPAAAGGNAAAPADPATTASNKEGAAEGAPEQPPPATGTQENPPGVTPEAGATDPAAPASETPPEGGGRGQADAQSPNQDTAAAAAETPRKNRVGARREHAAKQKPESDKKSMEDLEKTMEKMTPEEREQVRRALKGGGKQSP